MRSAENKPTKSDEVKGRIQPAQQNRVHGRVAAMLLAVTEGIARMRVNRMLIEPERGEKGKTESVLVGK